MVDIIEVSLKGQDGRWTGQSDESALHPTTGRFERLHNCYVGCDGTEIVRAPGIVKVGDPKYTDEQYAITAVDTTPVGATDLTLTFPTAPAEHFLEPSVTYTIYLNGPSFPVELETTGQFQSATILRVNTEVTITTSDTVLIKRAFRYHGVRFVNGQACAVAEGVYYENLDADVFRKRRGIEVWTYATRLKLSNPTGFPGAWTRRRNPILPRQTGTTTNDYYNFNPRRRCGLDVADNRLLIAVPGCGVCYQHIVDNLYQPPYTMALGNTKANISGAAVDVRWGAGVDSTELGTMTGAPTASFAVAYKNRVTGEFGLASGSLQLTIGAVAGAVDLLTNRSMNGGTSGTPTTIQTGANLTTQYPDLAVGDRFAVEITVLPNGLSGLTIGRFEATVATIGANSTFTIPVTTTSAYVSGGTFQIRANAFVIDCWKPRRALRESAEATITLFATDLNSPFAGLRALEESDPFSLAPDSPTNQIHNFIRYRTWTHDGKNARFPNIEQMPMGASWIKTIRGFTFFGGPLSSITADPVNENYTNSSFHFENLRIRTVLNDTTRFYVIDPIFAAVAVRGRVAADRMLPSSFFGAMIGLSRSGSQYELVRTTDYVNGNAQRWTIEGGAWRLSDVASEVDKDAYLLLERGKVWFTEQGFPGICPASNRFIVDKIQGFDVIAGGRYGGALVFCTNKETYLLSFGRSPLGSEPGDPVSTEHGCIAPQSMIDGDGFAAWIGEHYPVALIGGSVQPIGRQLRTTWRSLRRDSLGLMWQAIGVYDAQRKLGAFGVRSAAYTNSDDDLRSTEANDLVYLYSVQNTAWSQYQPSTGLTFHGAAPMLFDDGLYRICWQGQNGAIYSWDDSVYEQTNAVISVATPFSGTATTFFLGPSGAFNNVIVGQEAMIRSADGASIKWYGKIVAVDTVNNIVTLSTDQVPAASWNIGDVIDIGIIRMELRTTLSRFLEGGQQARRAHKIAGIIIEHELTKPEGGTAYGFCRALIVDENGTSTRLHEDKIAQSLDRYRTRIHTGQAYATESKLDLVFITNGFLKIKDIVVELAPGG